MVRSGSSAGTPKKADKGSKCLQNCRCAEPDFQKTWPIFQVRRVKSGLSVTGQSHQYGCRGVLSWEKKLNNQFKSWGNVFVRTLLWAIHF